MGYEKNTKSQENIIISGCAHHCGGICLWKVHVKDGRITRLETDDGEEPQLRGCLRGHALRQQVYAPDRLIHPLKRVGPRGSGQFESISWDEALEKTAFELKRVKQVYGPSAILLSYGGGNVTLLHGMDRAMGRLLNMFGGCTSLWGAPSWEAALFASAVSYGTTYVGNTKDDLVNSRLIILWGVNPATTIHSTNFCWYLAQAKEQGTKIIIVDPRFTESAAAFAHQWIPIKPSTDTAMLLAMAYIIIKENLYDKTFLDRYTIGFDKFKNYVLGLEDGVAKTPDWAESIAGVSALVIEKLAREYATRKPAALISGIAPGRTAFGEQFHRATITLAAMTGNVGKHGGEAAGRSFGDQYPRNPYPFRMDAQFVSGDNPVDMEAPIREIAIKRHHVPRSYARVHFAKQADAILKGKAGGYHADYKMFFVFNGNPVNSFPYTKKWVEALNKLEFMVVMEQFMTATARFADIILPVCTIFERNDIIAGGATPYYVYLKKIIEPIGQSKSPLQIAFELADKLGIPEFREKSEEEWLRTIVGGSDITDYNNFKEKAIFRLKHDEPYIAFKEQIQDPDNHPFETDSGKIEIYSQELAEKKIAHLPPIPKYFDPPEGPNDPLIKKYPLQLITSHFKRRAHTQFETLPWLREIEGNRATINVEDARVRGISDGDLIRIFNDRGIIIMPVMVTERIMPGVIDVPHGAWFIPDENGVDRGGCPNVLTSDEYSPCGALVCNTALVQVERA